MLILGCFLLLLLGLWMLLSPRSMYWKTGSWMYRHPKANEPSDIAYGITRVIGGVLVLGMIVAVVVVITEPSESEQEAEAEQEEAEEREREEQGLADLQASTEELDAEIRAATAGGALRDRAVVTEAADELGLSITLEDDFEQTGLVEVDGRPFELTVETACLTLPTGPEQESQIDISSICLAFPLPSVLLPPPEAPLTSGG